MNHRTRDHHGPPGTIKHRRDREKAVEYLDADDWLEVVRRELPYHRWGMVRGELELLGVLLDDAMTAIFRPLNRDHRAHEVQWIFGLEGLVGATAKDICAWLTCCGWSQTRRGYPTDYELLCDVVSRGLAMRLTLEENHRGHPQSAQARAKIGAANRAARARGAYRPKGGLVELGAAHVH
jgi:hypothetical protein